MATEEKDLANRLRWDFRRRGFYEVYFLKWNEPRSKTAGWIRYTLTSPLERLGPPYCELWAFFFDAVHPENTIALKERYSCERLRLEKDGALILLAGAELGSGHCRGEIKDDTSGHRLGWDLRIESQSRVFYHFPWRQLYNTVLPRTKVLSPHHDARFFGRFIVDDRHIILEGSPGVQSHLWGSRHNLRWSWGHCNCFREDAQALWEGMDGQVRHGGVPSVHFKMFYLKAFGQEHVFNAPLKWLLNRSRTQPGRWEFAVRDRRVRILGHLQADLESFVGVTYVDPDGEKIFCHNTEVASARIRVEFSDGRPAFELNAEHTCALEHADRRSVLPGSPLRL